MACVSPASKSASGIQTNECHDHACDRNTPGKGAVTTSASLRQSYAPGKECRTCRRCEPLVAFLSIDLRVVLPT